MPGPAQATPLAPTPPPKKRVWPVVLIIVVVGALVVGLGAFFVGRAIIGNRNTAYCQTYTSLSDHLPSISDQLTQAQTSGDLKAVSTALGNMIAQFQGLENASAPNTAVTPLTSILSYLTTLQTLANNNDPNGYNDYVQQNFQSVFQASVTRLDNATLQYCK